ncbi:MAG: RNA polymerase sigma factor [Candidatus Limnocylindrales bacterium]
MFRRAGERAVERLVPFDVDRPAVEAARRDPCRFEPLYRKYVGQVYSFATYELHDRHAAEDVTEQVFLRALHALPQFDERGVGAASTFRVWLFQIARHALSNERRRRARHPEAPLDAVLEMAAADADPAAQVVERDAVRRAWRAIEHLPHERRRAITLRFVEEMTTSEIAGAMGRSEGAVRVLIHRALRSVADELGRD